MGSKIPGVCGAAVDKKPSLELGIKLSHFVTMTRRGASARQRC